MLDTDWNVTSIAATDRSLSICSQLLNIKLRDNARFAPMIYAPASHTFDGHCMPKSLAEIILCAPFAML